jgi:hypothetical protein
VFCNRLKFSEFVKTAEIIWRLAGGHDRRPPAAAVRLLALKLFWLMACGLPRAVVWHQSPIKLDERFFLLSPTVGLP